jgi:glycosyltransferase involved in cell wall biosynthesis
MSTASRFLSPAANDPRAAKSASTEALWLLRRIRLALSQAFPQRTLLDFTVAICTYNGENRLPLVLECLLWQLNTADLAWEVVVIDNNSSDGTAKAFSDFAERWPSHIPLRYGFEPRQGASFARQHAVEIARSPLIGFLDDDNLPSMLWVASAYQFAKAHPQAGVFGSRIRGDFEINPPPNFERIAAFLALTERGSDPLLYEPQRKVLPPGAGLVVRREAWLAHVPPVLSLGGHSGGREAGEDLEVVLYIQQAGWEVWYNPQMQMHHKIPKNRLGRDYLIKLCRGIGLSRHRTRMLSFPYWQRPLVAPLYVFNDVRRVLRHLLKYRTAVVTDTVTACEMTMYLYSLISPFYIWQRRLRQSLGRCRREV